ncbi:hypothetical protein [Photobacterium angustum]|uniref:hypothetical protein n=1 Tax=Photobacterium angustum TaxID=661 RepID=UPI0005DE3DCB|nr:hypothetical protein [Photobacterium angustum]KJG00111.1 hypothetical protein UB35_19880 [Photobacterium angustum]PSV61672.1 hypothetical protein CTM95_20435 [Photobacterium angustum]
MTNTNDINGVITALFSAGIYEQINSALATIAPLDRALTIDELTELRELGFDSVPVLGDTCLTHGGAVMNAEQVAGMARKSGYVHGSDSTIDELVYNAVWLLADKQMNH